MLPRQVGVPAWVTGRVVTAGNDSSNGVELWKSEGTRPGVVMVQDISTIGHE